jgi:hypothetical protein
MIKHIVMFKLLEKAESASREENAVLIHKMLCELPGKIPEIKFYEVGINIIESERAYDMVIISEFESMAALETYLKHPEHIKAVGFIAKRRADSKSVDYEVK